jgi:hypothetical protein
MNLTPYVEGLRRQLIAAAAPGGADAVALAERLIAPLEASLRLALLEALSDAASQITTELAPGSVEVRLRGGEPEFVVTVSTQPASVQEPAAAGGGASLAGAYAGGDPPLGAASGAAAEGDDGGTARITLRLLEHLKVRLENAAAVEGLSVNAWLNRTLASAADAVDRRTNPVSRSGSGQRFTGWLR